MKRLLWALFLGCIAVPPFVMASDVEFQNITIKRIASPVQIEQFRSELILGDEAIERLMLVDVMNDGFDEADVVLIYPSGRVLRLRPISPALDSLLRSFTVPVNVAVYETNRRAAHFDTMASQTIGSRALGYGLLAGLSRAIDKGYHGTDVEGTFKFSLSGASLTAWNFDSVRIYFPPPEPTPIDTVVITNTIYRVDTVVIHDTLYIPSELLEPPRSMYYRTALGLIGGRYDNTQRNAGRQRILLGAGNEWDYSVWSPWVSGRQDVRSRVGLRFMVEMAPWKVDTLSPGFLGTSFEALWIPAWDRNLFLFGGFRAFYRDDPFWDVNRGARNDDDFDEPTLQDMSRYEITARFGVDKMAAYGALKKFGAWMKLSAWVGNSEQHLEMYGGNHFFKYENAGEVEGAVVFRFSETGQAVASLGITPIPNFEYSMRDSTGIHIEGVAGLAQTSQTFNFRWAPLEGAGLSQLLLDLKFRNTILARKHLKHAVSSLSGPSSENVFEEQVEKHLYPYLETPVFSGSLRLDVSIFRISGGASYYMPPDNRDAQTLFFGDLRLMFR